MEKKFVCSECKSVYFYYKNLRKHARKVHPDKISDIAPIQKSKKTFKYKCDICGKQFNHSYNFRYHQRKIHNLGTSDVISVKRLEKLKCPLCFETYPSKKKLLNHIECVHCINIEVNNVKLCSFKDYMKWKEKIEIETLSKYIKEHGSKKDSGFIKHYFVCHRSGHYNPEGKGQRKIKSQGSQKINGICPASMLVHESLNGECNVQYISTHVGHHLDVDHLSLTSTEKELLAVEIANKTPFQTIIEEARSKFVDCRQSRISLVKKKDLYNIQRKLRRPKKRCIIESTIEEINSNDTISVLFYKLPNQVDEKYPELESGDFVLIVMNRWLCGILKKHGCNFICVDKTSSSDTKCMKLYSVLTVDDYRQAYPCAFLITNRCDQCVFNLFFEKIKFEIGKLSTLVFMSFLEEYVFDSWTRTMGDPKMKHYCSWDVLEEWDNNQRFIKNSSKRSEVLNILKEFMYEQDNEGIEIKLSIVIQQLIENLETIDFGKYLNENFLKTISYWSFCYRYKDIIEVNSNLERMHASLKHLFICGRNCSRLNSSIYSIVNFILKALVNDLIIVQDSELNFFLEDTQTKHNTCLKLLSDSVVFEEPSCWKIQSTVSPFEVHYVKRYLPNCNCKLICVDCNVCVHKYVCSCLDSYVKWNICKHIHILCNFFSSCQDKSVKACAADENFSVPFESEVVISECGEILVQINENCNKMDNVIEELNSDINESDKEQLKEEFMELIDGISTENELDIVKESMSTLKALLSATPAQTICVNSNKLLEADNDCIQIVQENHV